MRIPGILLAIGVLASAILPPATASKPGRQLVAKGPDFVEVVNDKTPPSSALGMEFVPDLTLRQDGWTPFALRVDQAGDICVISGKDPTLIKFDRHGRETFRKAFRSGQGPGEFGFFDPEFAADGRMLVLDGRQRRMTSFDRDFRLLGISMLGLWGDNFRLDSSGNMYVMLMEFLPDTRDRQLLTLTKVSLEGKLLRRIHEYEWGMTRDRGAYHSDAFRSQLRFEVDDRDNIWYAATDRYEIHVVSPDGALTRTIIKKGEPRRLSEGEVAEFKARGAKSPIVTDIPERVPPIAGLFLVEPDLVLVVTFESGPGDETLAGDLFDRTGAYRGRARVPKYDGWDFLMAPSKPMALARGGFFYAIETPGDGDETIVRRYKIVVKES